MAAQRIAVLRLPLRETGRAGVMIVIFISQQDKLGRNAMTTATPDADTLREMLLAARARTLALCADLDGDRRLGPRMTIVNPPLWEVGHVGWFQEHWCLRHRSGGAPGPSLIDGADQLYNSAIVPHATRWDLPLPDFRATLGYLERTLEREGATDHLRYFTQLAVFHEEMHNEAFTYTRQTLGYPAPQNDGQVTGCDDGALPGDVEIPGGEFRLGAEAGGGFVFDNEKWGHRVTVAPFRMARAPVTNASFCEFVEDGGYRQRALWSDTGWRWRVEAKAEAPVYWKKEGGSWRVRHYDRWLPLRPYGPVIHTNWYEAEAWCRWAGRRLPAEAEWEFAAAVARQGEPKRRYPWGDAPATAHHANLHGVAAHCVDVAAFPDGDSRYSQLSKGQTDLLLDN